MQIPNITQILTSYPTCRLTVQASIVLAIGFCCRGDGGAGACCSQSGMRRAATPSSCDLPIPQGGTGGGGERTMPPGPGGVADATITVYVEDSGGTVYAAAIVVRKARCRPSHLVGRMATNATIMNITTTTSIGWWDRRCGGGRAGAPARRGIVIAVWILPCRHRRRQRQHSRGGRRCPPTRQSMYPSTSSGRYMRRELSQR